MTTKPLPKEKKCPNCEQTLPADKFYVRNDKVKGKIYRSLGSWCIECCKERNKKPEVRAKMSATRKWRWANDPEYREKELARGLAYRQTDKYKAWITEYLARPETKERRRKYMKMRRDTDPLFAMCGRVRCRINEVLDGEKSQPTLDIVGCESAEALRDYLEDNPYGYKIDTPNISIDHIIPLEAARNDDEIYLLCHHTNLQLLTRSENSAKGARVPFLDELPECLIPELLDYYMDLMDRICDK